MSTLEKLATLDARTYTVWVPYLFETAPTYPVDAPEPIGEPNIKFGASVYWLLQRETLFGLFQEAISGIRTSGGRFVDNRY